MKVGLNRAVGFQRLIAGGSHGCTNSFTRQGSSNFSVGANLFHLEASRICAPATVLQFKELTFSHVSNSGGAIIFQMTN